MIGLSVNEGLKTALTSEIHLNRALFLGPEPSLLLEVKGRVFRKNARRRHVDLRNISLSEPTADNPGPLSPEILPADRARLCLKKTRYSDDVGGDVCHWYHPSDFFDNDGDTECWLQQRRIRLVDKVFKKGTGAGLGLLALRGFSCSAYSLGSDTVQGAVLNLVLLDTRFFDDGNTGEIGYLDLLTASEA